VSGLNLSVARRAYELRQSGCALEQIGTALGVSIERARQRVIQYTRYLETARIRNPRWWASYYGGAVE
jgi:hypothetical protein